MPDGDTATDTGTGSGGDHTVCDDGVAPFTELQDAFDTAADGDVIRVCAGTYEWVVIDRAELTMEGAGSDVTFVEGGEDHTAMYVTDSTLTLRDFALGRTGDPVNLGAARYLENSTFTGSGLRIHDTVDGAYGGIGVSLRDSDGALEDILVEDNAMGAAIGAFDSDFSMSATCSTYL